VLTRPCWQAMAKAWKSGKTKAIAYMRTSSASNVGADKDSDRRQAAAIETSAKARGYELVDQFYDAAVKGSDPVTARPGFSAMLDRMCPHHPCREPRPIRPRPRGAACRPRLPEEDGRDPHPRDRTGPFRRRQPDRRARPPGARRHRSHPRSIESNPQRYRDRHDEPPSFVTLNQSQDDS
jgi:hypothetical protein